MPRMRIELIIKEAFVSKSTLDDLERLFSTNKKILTKQITEVFSMNNFAVLSIRKRNL